MRKLTKEQIENKLQILYGGDVSVDFSTYVNTSTKAKFVSITFGEWFAKPNDVFNGHLNYAAGWSKRQETCLEKYGVSHVSKMSEIKIKKIATCLNNYGTSNPQQNSTIALKTAKSSNRTEIKRHWKTNEELVCQGSYESKTVDFLNKNKTEFEWQPRTFNLTSEKTYRPDLFLIKEGKWVEIKGWMRKDAQEKWDQFQTMVAKSELWNKHKLKEIGIL